jgi:hypothetical protein
MLFHTRQQAVVRKRNVAGKRRQRAVQHFQQGAFAAAIVANKSKAIAFSQGKREIGE